MKLLCFRVFRSTTSWPGDCSKKYRDSKSKVRAEQARGQRMSNIRKFIPWVCGALIVVFGFQNCSKFTSAAMAGLSSTKANASNVGDDVSNSGTAVPAVNNVGISFSPSLDSNGNITQSSVTYVSVILGVVTVGGSTVGGKLQAIFNLNSIQGNACYQMALALLSSNKDQSFEMLGNFSQTTLAPQAPPESGPSTQTPSSAPQTFQFTAADSNFDCVLRAN
jgi:hypothetical protein